MDDFWFFGAKSPERMTTWAPAFALSSVRFQVCSREATMRKTILTFGLISGAVSSLMMGVSMAFADRIGIDRGYIVGYTTIVLSCLFIYFGVRSYRENVSGGAITFARAFGVGLAIGVISCLCYVVTWEIIYFNFMPDFLDKFDAYEIAKLKAAGASAAVLQRHIEEQNHMKVLYANPLFNAALTFIEPFPVALLVTLISAAVLRKRPALKVAA
jgi:hypothetical protein